MTVKEFINPMYKMAVSVQACYECAEKDFPNEKCSKNRFYCHNKPVSDLKTEKEYERILDYDICCVTQRGAEIIIQVGTIEY